MIIKTRNSEGQWDNEINLGKAARIEIDDYLTLDVGDDDGDLFIRSPDGRLVITADAANKIFIKVE